MNASLTSYPVIATLFCFLLSVGASVIAINLYSLLRTGKLGSSWRVLIIASVLFATGQAVKLAEVTGIPYASTMHLSSIVDLVFVLALAYAFYLQRQVFSEARTVPHDEKWTAVEEDEEDKEEKREVSAYEHLS